MAKEESRGRKKEFLIDIMSFYMVEKIYDIFNMRILFQKVQGVGQRTKLMKYLSEIILDVSSV